MMQSIELPALLLGIVLCMETFVERLGRIPVQNVKSQRFAAGVSAALQHLGEESFARSGFSMTGSHIQIFEE